jgi:hypothetical protein
MTSVQVMRSVRNSLHLRNAQTIGSTSDPYISFSNQTTFEGIAGTRRRIAIDQAGSSATRKLATADLQLINICEVMSAIERARTAALAGYVARCENKECAHTIIAVAVARRWRRLSLADKGN